ncbi:uncharacterized protein LOC128548169 [Mercenaria mercenaria]|uniref:uncharacterized protein LOC128548169 n=1 Tax=Mercenaria mercenaria TaxID=6596 RepID=UPI00234F29FB|nr:uncharacterized protein LOC128548169 [Mercenaria mercenaria]
MASYLLQSKADNTVNKYFNSFTQFEKFCHKNKLVSKPAHPFTVGLYFTSLMDEGKSNHVVTSAFYSIKWVHNINDMEDPTESPVVKQLLEAAKRTHSKPVCKKDVVSTHELHSLCSMFIDSDDICILRDLSMIMITYAGFMRISEVLNLKCKDVRFSEDHVTIYVSKSKTDIYRNGSDIVISKGSTSACPYVLLQKYMNAANLNDKPDEFLFKPALRSKNVVSLVKVNKPLSYTRAKECIVSKLKLVAPNRNLGTHSLRASGITEAAKSSDISERCLKRHGRWKSDIAKDGYVKDSIEKRLAVSKKLDL